MTNTVQPVLCLFGVVVSGETLYIHNYVAKWECILLLNTAFLRMHLHASTFWLAFHLHPVCPGGSGSAGGKPQSDEENGSKFRLEVS